MKKIKKILYPTDFSDCSKQAYKHALFLSEKYGAELHLFHVITLHSDDPNNPDFNFPNFDEYKTQIKKEVKEKTARIVQEHDTDKTKIITAQERGVSPSENILEYAKKNNIDLIVMGTHGRRGLGYMFLGSVAQEVTRFSLCPVYTIREQEKPKKITNINKILVPVDLSKYSKLVLAYAKILANEYDSKIEIIHIVDDRVHPSLYASGKKSIFDFMPDIKKNSTKMIEKMWKEVDAAKNPYKINIIEGVIAREILNYIEDNKIDLVVISTHGRSGLDHFLLGSVAEKVIRRSICPVFTVKSFGKQLI